jgi:hypothetical protein
MLMCSLHWKLVPFELQRAVSLEKSMYETTAAVTAIRYVECFKLLRQHMAAVAARDWLCARQPELEMCVPQDLIVTSAGWHMVMRSIERMPFHTDA